MTNHLIKWTTLEISAYTFVCYPCFVIIDHEMKEINRSPTIHIPLVLENVLVSKAHYHNKQTKFYGKFPFHGYYGSIHKLFIVNINNTHKSILGCQRNT